MSWFKDWFNTKHYHILYKDRDDNEAENFIKAIAEHLQIFQKSMILDLACGRGRHSIFLNNLGYNITGVDLSEESIISAKKHENNSLHFDTHDMRKVYKENEFDYIFNLFTSFGYFDKEAENQLAVNAMFANLKQGGKLVLDFMNTQKVIDNLVDSEIKVVDDIEFSITRMLENGFLKKKINFTDTNKDYSFEESVKALYKSDFEQYFTNAGFNIIDVFGDYGLSNFDIDKSDRLIFVCEK